MDTFMEGANGHKEGTLTDRTKYVVRIDGDITKDAEISIREKPPKETGHVYHCPNCKGKKTIWTLEDYAEKGTPVCGICGDDMEIVRTKGGSKP